MAINLVCEKCGGDEIEFEATAIWNINDQDYIYELGKGAWCWKCEDLVTVKEIEI